MLAFAEHDFPGTTRLAREYLAKNPPTFWRAFVMGLSAAAAGSQGQLAQFEQLAQATAAIDAGRGVPGSAIVDGVWGAFSDLRYRSRPADALARVQRVLAKYPLAAIPAADRPYSYLAWIYADAGQPADAEHTLAEYARFVPAGIRRVDYTEYGARGAIAMAENRLQDAAPLFRIAFDSSGCTTCAMFDLANVYDRMKQPDSALAVYRRYVDNPGIDRYNDDPVSLAPTYRRLGELYEARGDRVNALTYYNKFVDLWTNADPELQPAVRDVKQRIAALAGEH